MPCPFEVRQDDRKSAALAAANLEVDPGALVVDGYAPAQAILRNPAMLQAGIGADEVKVGNPDQMSVFFLDGPAHKRRRSAIARFFTPKAINSRYRRTMELVSERLIADMRRTGSARLDVVSFQLAVEVAAEIIGLTDSDPLAMAERIRKTLDNGGGTYRLKGWRRWAAQSAAVSYAIQFLLFDVWPAARARRKTRRDDVISLMLDERYSIKALLIECLTYAAAGMVTTREFIVMAAWHLLEREDLRVRYLEGGEEEQILLLEEILRLEPIASVLHRRGPDAAGPDGQAPGQLFALDVRAANTDEANTGPCPHAIDPDRHRHMKGGVAALSFGDGAHRCPGAQVALHEARLFLDRLLRVPGLRLAQAPQISWRSDLMSYELRNAVVTCDLAR